MIVRCQGTLAMKIHRRNRVFLACVTAAVSLAGCSKERPVATADSAMLMDAEVAQASLSLIRLQERPTFPVDENQKQYAMNEDRTDKVKPKDEPTSIEESR